MWDESSISGCGQDKDGRGLQESKNSTLSMAITSLGEDIDRAEDYTFLGAHLDNRLDWRCSTETVYKKVQSRLCQILSCMHQDAANLF